MKTMLKDVPIFDSEEDERSFWSEHDSTEYINWDDAETALLPRLKPSTKSISLRLPETMLNQLRVIANKRDIPYQSLIKLFLSERIEQELDVSINKAHIAAKS
ncbi:MAG: BrnA antitoxin family protein [Caldilineaceae bacterium]